MRNKLHRFLPQIIICSESPCSSSKHREPAQQAPGYVTESALKANCDSTGTCIYTFQHGVPAKATGTYAIGVETRRTETLLPGTTSATSVTYGAKNQVVYFSVDGSPVVDRRVVVSVDNCNQCHVALSEHGSLRNQTEYCVFCHNPSQTDAAARAMAQNPADKAAPPQGITFPLLVHRIHFGENMLANGGSYTVVGFNGSHNDFSTVRVRADESSWLAGRHAELRYLSCEWIGGEPSSRTKRGRESAGVDQSGASHGYRVLGMPCGSGRGVAFPGNDYISRRTLHCMPCIRHGF